MSEFDLTVAVVQQWANPNTFSNFEAILESLWTAAGPFYPNGCLDLITRLQAEFPKTDVVKLHVNAFYASASTAPGGAAGNPNGVIKTVNDLGIAVTNLLA